ncbi:hypothetical protein CCO03_06055 [Comamonas serinivorans]|uniref:Uncharacterized protein n=1 Tax=Comamonas serinivorans TaxID=1082851 RepID=A0A1Y0ELS4_9BURK|nr:hypothetical protein [Comamonas serinivorans]ARU04299.1 hypothetical protein CCO03_06055 [Comamonas serinivorans]
MPPPVQQNLLQRALCVVIGLVLACVTAALLAGIDPAVVCQPDCTTLDGLKALIGADATRWLLAALCAGLALGFTLKGLRKPGARQPGARQPGARQPGR